VTYPSRRDFLKAGAATAAAVSATGLGFDVARAQSIKQSLKIAGAKEVHSLCPYCAVGCSLVAYTKHLGPVRAAEAVERFGDRVFEVLRDTPEALCVIKGITPERADAIRESFAAVATIVSVEARHAAWIRDLLGELPAPAPANPSVTAAQAMAAIRRTGFVKGTA